MAKVAMTTAQIAPVFPQKAIIYDRIASVAIAAGELVSINNAGKAVKAKATNANTLVNLGVALNKAGAGQAVSVLKSGHVAGFTLTSLDYGAAIYASDTDGEAADAAGTVSKVIGRVEAIAQADGPAKVLYVDAVWA